MTWTYDWFGKSLLARLKKNYGCQKNFACWFLWAWRSLPQPAMTNLFFFVASLLRYSTCWILSECGGTYPCSGNHWGSDWELCTSSSPPRWYHQAKDFMLSFSNHRCSLPVQAVSYERGFYSLHNLFLSQVEEMVLWEGTQCAKKKKA